MKVDHADVAIVGGGVIGLSVARELRRAGVQRVVIIEKEASVGRGSSTRANGGVRAQFTTATNVAFSLYSIAEIERLNDTYAPELAFRQTGYLLFTAEPERARALQSAAELQRSLGAATELVSPERIVELAPIVRGAGLVAGAYHGRDGYLDPHGFVAVLERDARQLGVQMRTNCEVAAIEATGDGFELACGEARRRAEYVVNAAGAHARAVAALLGVDVPVQPLRRNLAYLHDEDAPRTALPMCVDLDTGVLVRTEGPAGYLIAYSEPDDPPGWKTELDPRFLPAVAARIGNRFPALENKPIHPKHCWAGLYPETPDHHAIIGSPPGIPHFIQCIGFGGHGLMHAPAAGKAVAELVTIGRCDSFDLHPVRVTRFAEGDLVRETAVF